MSRQPNRCFPCLITIAIILMVAACEIITRPPKPLSAAPDHGASRNVRPLVTSWQLLDASCVDLYSVDAEGELPEGGAPGGDLSVFDTFAVAYNLQANHADHIQVSGVPDGLCDHNPSQIRGQFTVTAPGSFYIGPVNLPRQGWYVVSEWPGKLVANFVYLDVGMDGFWSPSPDVHDFWPFATTGKMPELRTWYSMGTPDVVDSPFIIDAGNAPLPVAPTFLRVRYETAGTYTVNLAIVPITKAAVGIEP